MPPAEQVRETLERILSSEVFARSERARDLLRYIVEQDLAGHADRLKGFSIAVDVFGKGAQFDPANDTVVRVQAGRLRDLLALYRAGPGADDPLHISIPRGSYVPDYAMRETIVAAPVDTKPEPAAGSAPVVPEPAARTSRMLMAAVAAALAILFVFGYRAITHQSLTETAALAGDVISPVGFGERTGSVSQESLPAVFLEVRVVSENANLAAAAMRRGLTGYDTVELIGRHPVFGDRLAHKRTDYAFTLREESAPGVVQLELQNVVSGRVLLSQTLRVAGKNRATIDDMVADVLTTVAPASGIIYAHTREDGAQTELIHCLALNDAFYRDQKPEAHRAAYECLESLAANESKSALVYSELASLHMQAIVSRYDYPPVRSEADALHLARKAVELGPNSPYAHRSMGYVLSRTASSGEALRWTRKAYELNTFDLGMAASYGYALIFAGNYLDGTPILARAVNAASAHPTWWDYGLFLGNFMLDDMEAAANAASALASSNRAHYIAVRLLAADGLGRTDEASPLLARLVNDHAVFAADPKAFFDKGNYPRDMSEKLVGALRTAGLGGES